MNDDMRRAQLSRGLGELEVREGQPSPLAQPLDAALRGAVFPLSAEHLVLVARENEAPSVLLTLLSSLPRRTYASLDTVTRVLEGDAAEARNLDAPPPQR